MPWSAVSPNGEPGTPAGRAFISYVHEDSAHVDRLVQILEVAGIPVWRDTAQLWPGQDWRAQIRGAIAEDALAFLACFSQASLARAQSYQNEELIEAIDQLRLRPHDVPWLVPVRFDDCQIPDRGIGAGRTLRSLHYASLFGHQYLQEAGRLVQVIRQILGDAAEPARRPPPAARGGLAPEISVGGPDVSDGAFNPPVRSVVYVDVSEPLDDLTACHVTDHDRGGTTDLGHAPFHISTSRWRIRSDFQLRSVRDVIIGYTVIRSGRKVQRFQYDGYDHAYDWHAPSADGSHLSAFHQIKQARLTGQGADRQPEAEVPSGQQDQPAGRVLSSFSRIVLRGGPRDGEVVQHDRHPEAYVALSGSRWHTWRHLDRQAWRRVGSDDLPVYDYAGSEQP